MASPSQQFRWRFSLTRYENFILLPRNPTIYALSHKPRKIHHHSKRIELNYDECLRGVMPVHASGFPYNIACFGFLRFRLKSSFLLDVEIRMIALHFLLVPTNFFICVFIRNHLRMFFAAIDHKIFKHHAFKKLFRSSKIVGPLDSSSLSSA